MRMLLIEDEEAFGSATREQLMADGHAADWAKDLDEARHYASVADYEIILLDVLLPDGNGIDYLREISKGAVSRLVIIVIMTCRDQTSQKVEALDAGADDYMVKPFDLDELSARIRAVARRRAGYTAPICTLGPLTINVAEKHLERDGQRVNLTRREWAVFEYLFHWLGKTVSKTKIEDALYNLGSEIESNTVEVYISRLRKKIGGGRILTGRGFGYRLVDTW
ncbi:DNA-binding response regulator [Sinorhizobium medicae]|nr:response regulator transcription factor [Sinorhizobium medicae]PLU11726.1 DNA-binding response regulator [Sinorhizobium medicae]